MRMQNLEVSLTGHGYSLMNYYKKTEKSFLSGPYDVPPFVSYRVSPLEIAEHRYSKMKGLIL